MHQQGNNALSACNKAAVAVAYIHITLRSTCWFLLATDFNHNSKIMHKRNSSVCKIIHSITIVANLAKYSIPLFIYPRRQSVRDKAAIYYDIIALYKLIVNAG